jgi:hypothetical protein
MIRWSRFAVVAVSGVLLSGSMLAVPMARAVVAEPAVVPAVAGDTAGRASPAVWRRYDWRPGVRQNPPYQGYAERFRFAPGWRAREWGRGSPREWSGRAGSGLRFGDGWYGRPDRPYFDRRRPGWRPEWRPERRYVPNGTWRYGRQVGGSDWYVRPSAVYQPAL